MKRIVPLVFVFSLGALYFTPGCKKNSETVASQSEMDYVSHQSLGCSAQTGLPKKTDDIGFNWSYTDGSLKLEFLFSTHCLADMKDSVIADGNAISIFLADTSSLTARCFCLQHEVFEFTTPGNRDVRILFHYKTNAQDEYVLMTDLTIHLL